MSVYFNNNPLKSSIFHLLIAAAVVPIVNGCTKKIGSKSKTERIQTEEKGQKNTQSSSINCALKYHHHQSVYYFPTVCVQFPLDSMNVYMMYIVYTSLFSKEKKAIAMPM